MDKKLIEKKLAELMDIIPECEGLIAADVNGKVIIGQTITEMDHNVIAKACTNIIKDSNTLGKNIDKGTSNTTTIELDKGFAVLVGSDELILIGLTGLDGRASLSFLKRNLSLILNL